MNNSYKNHFGNYCVQYSNVYHVWQKYDEQYTLAISYFSVNIRLSLKAMT